MDANLTHKLKPNLCIFLDDLSCANCHGFASMRTFGINTKGINSTLSTWCVLKGYLNPVDLVGRLFNIAC